VTQTEATPTETEATPAEQDAAPAEASCAAGEQLVDGACLPSEADNSEAPAAEDTTTEGETAQ
jgi:hypothetical protein